jgi:hypothetical protein
MSCLVFEPKRTLIKVLYAISTRGSTRRADTARAVIGSISSYGLDPGLVSTNPASGLRNRHDYQPRDGHRDARGYPAPVSGNGGW